MTKKTLLERKELLTDKEINTLTQMAERALSLDSPTAIIGIATNGTSPRYAHKTKVKIKY